MFYLILPSVHLLYDIISERDVCSRVSTRIEKLPAAKYTYTKESYMSHTFASFSRAWR